MTSYRIITVSTTDTTAPRFVIVETRDGGEERVASEHNTQADADSHLEELRERAEFWQKPKWKEQP